MQLIDGIQTPTVFTPLKSVYGWGDGRLQAYKLFSPTVAVRTGEGASTGSDEDDWWVASHMFAFDGKRPCPHPLAFPVIGVLL